MRKILLIICIFVAFGSVAQAAVISDSCQFKGKKLFGRVKVVDSFPDFKVQIVKSFPDLRVQVVNSFADSCGKWHFVDSFPDFTIQYVTAFPDFKIQFVEELPGKS